MGSVLKRNNKKNIYYSFIKKELSFFHTASGCMHEGALKKSCEYMKTSNPVVFQESVNQSTPSVKPDSQSALQPQWSSPLLTWDVLWFTWKSTSCWTCASALFASWFPDLRSRNLHSPPQEQHLHHMTADFSTALTLIFPEGLFQWDGRDNVNVQQAPSVCLETSSYNHGGFG